MALERDIHIMQQRLQGKDDALAPVPDTVNEQEQRIAELLSERDELFEGKKHAERELAEAQARLSSLQSMLAQRQEEISQAYAEIAEQIEAIKSLRETMEIIQEGSDATQRKLAEANAWVFRLSADRAALETQTKQLKHQLKNEEAAYKRDKSFIAGRLHKAEARASRLEADCQARGVELNQALEAQQTAAMDLNDRYLEIVKLTQFLQDMQKSAVRSQDENKSIEKSLNERYREIAKLSDLLKQKEDAAEKSQAEIDWLCEAGAILLTLVNTRRAWLFRILPAELQYKRQRKMLKRKGLFDTEAYLNAHPDVRDSGTDPLLHYLKHGIKEKRFLPK